QQEPTALVPDELECRLAVVQPVEDPAALSLRHHAPGDGLAARPRATPSQRASVNSRLRPSSTTIGRVNMYAVTRSRIVDSPRKKANPRTDPTLRRYSNAAPMSDTRSAARIVR